MKMPVLCVKLGGSLITDKSTPYKANITAIRNIARDLKSIKTPLLIAHGSGSFAHTSAKKYGGGHGYSLKLGVAKVARDAMEINRIIMDIFVEEGLPAISLRPMSMILSSGGKLKKNLFEIVEETLRQGLIPVVYGDIIWDTKWKSTIFSGEKTLNEIALYLKKRGFIVSKIIQVGKTNGVYDNKGKTIPLISHKNWKNIKRYVFESKDADVTGGMMHKIENALSITDKNIETQIINGTISNELFNALHGKTMKGTVIS